MRGDRRNRPGCIRRPVIQWFQGIPRGDPGHQATSFSPSSPARDAREGGRRPSSTRRTIFLRTMTQQRPEQEASEPLQQQQRQFGDDEKRNTEGPKTGEGLRKNASSRRRSGSDSSLVAFAVSDVDVVVESPSMIPTDPTPPPRRPWDSRLGQDSTLVAPDSGGGDVGFEFRSAWSLPEITADQIFFNGRIKPLYLGSGISHPNPGKEFIRPQWIGKGPDPRPLTLPPLVEDGNRKKEEATADSQSAHATTSPPLPPKRMTPVAAGVATTTATARRQRAFTASMPSMRTLVQTDSTADVSNERLTATTDPPSASVAVSTASAPTSPKTRRLSGQDEDFVHEVPRNRGFCLWAPGACGSGGAGLRKPGTMAGGRSLWGTWELLASRAVKLKKKAADGSPTAGPEPGVWKPKHATGDDKKREEWAYM